MEPKRGRERNSWRRVWGILCALWLVVACAAGCVTSAPDTRQIPTGQAVGTQKEVVEAGGIGEVSTAEERNGGTEESASTEAGGSTEEPAFAGQSGDTEASTREGTEPGNKAGPSETGPEESGEEETGASVEESGHYTSKEEVALYLHLYGRLPDNYLTKKEAESLGWDSRAGNLWEVAPGMSIGGSRFGNYEKALPEKKGRRYYECDIDYEGGYRGAKRIIYSDDGLIFYTEDHYKTFEQLYGQ